MPDTAILVLMALVVAALGLSSASLSLLNGVYAVGFYRKGKVWSCLFSSLIAGGCGSVACCAFYGVYILLSKINWE